MKELKKQSSVSWVLISILLLVLIGFNSYLGTVTVNKLSTLQNEIRASEEFIARLKTLQIKVLTAESGIRGYVLTQKAKYLRDYQQVIGEIDAINIDLLAYAEESDGRQGRIVDLVNIVKSKSDYLEYVAKLDKADDEILNELIGAGKGYQLYSEMLALFNQLNSNEKAFLDKNINAFELATSESRTNLFISLLISVLLVIGVFFLARANIKSQYARQTEMEAQNDRLQLAVDERTQELSMFSEELKRSNRELEDFAFVASHDLQEPLRKIMAFGDRLVNQSDNLSEKQSDYLNRMRNAASRMSTLISDLLEFSRVNTRGKPFVNIDLDSLINQVLDDLSILIEETNAKIEVDQLPNISADPMQIQQLFTNLIANGIKFSKNEEQSLIKISVKRVDAPNKNDLVELNDWYEFSIVDNGIGFENEHAEKIFAPFQRLHTRSEFKGTGIGLAICRRIVERHNGTINASSKLGEGATFTFCLPAENQLISLVQEETEQG